MKTLSIITIAAAGLLALGACHKQTPAENAADNTAGALENQAAALDNAADATGNEALANAADASQNAADAIEGNKQ